MPPIFKASKSAAHHQSPTRHTPTMADAVQEPLPSPSDGDGVDRLDQMPTSPDEASSSSAAPARISPIYPPASPSEASSLPPLQTHTRRRDRGSMSTPGGSDFGGLSPGATDRVYPIRSAIQVDPNATPAIRSHPGDSYFGLSGRPDIRRASASTEGSIKEESGKMPSTPREKREAGDGEEFTAESASVASSSLTGNNSKSR